MKLSHSTPFSLNYCRHERRLPSKMCWRQNHAPWSLSLVAWVVMCGLAVMSACDDEAMSPSTLDGAQILAVQATPRALTPGTTRER